MRFLRVTGVHSGMLVLMIIAAAFVALKPSEVKTAAAVQAEIAAPPDKNAMEKFMARKLAAFEGETQSVIIERRNHCCI